MYALLIYSLKVGACLAVFYLFFKLLLSRETFHRLNRAVVLGALLLSFVLPLCVITVYREAPVLPEIRPALLAAAAEDAAAGRAAEPAFPWERLAGGVFLLGAAAVLLRTLWSLGCMARLIRSGRRERQTDGVVLVRSDRVAAPFSWGRYIVLPERGRGEDEEAILIHERAHLRLRHSLDLLAADLAGCLQWFNPAMWLLRREIRAIHEYEADEAVLASGVDARSYQLLLVRKAAGGRWYPVANSFNHSKLKKRITMMLRKKSSRWAGARALLLLPLAGLALGAFAETAYVFPERYGDLTGETGRLPGGAESGDVPDSVLRSRKKGPGPLILVNGVRGRSLDGIDPGEIASVTVLKDSLAAVRYGADAGQGVVLVELKPAAAGRTDSLRTVSATVVRGTGPAARQAVEAGMNAAGAGVRMGSAGIEIAGMALEMARDRMPAGEYEKAQRELEKARQELDAYMRSDEWKEAQRGISEAGAYFESDEWKEAQRKLSEAGAFFRSDEWKRLRKRMEETGAEIGNFDWGRLPDSLEGSLCKMDPEELERLRSRLDGRMERIVIRNGRGDANGRLSVSGTGADPVFFLDGRKVTAETVQKMDPRQIVSVTVLKDASSLEEYGEEGRGGVVKIVSKSGEANESGLSAPAVSVRVAPKRSVFDYLGDETLFAEGESSREMLRAIPADYRVYINGKLRDRSEIGAYSRIRKVRIYKNDAAAKRYGEAARAGVVEIQARR